MNCELGSNELNRLYYINFHYQNIWRTFLEGIIYFKGASCWQLTYLKVALSGLRQFLAAEHPSKMMKVNQENGFIKRLTLNLITSETEKQIIKIHVLFNISRREDNQTLKLYQFIEYKMRNTFLEKSCTKFSGGTGPIPFFKNQNWAYFWSNSLKFSKLLIVYPSWELWNIFKLRCWTVAFT